MGVPVLTTIDHKPGIPAERARIEAKGGEVRQHPEDTQDRVFIRNEAVPGLAMSRSFGDQLGHVCGVIHEPDIQLVKLNDSRDHYVILASDGVWEFMSNRSVMSLFAGAVPGEEQKLADRVANLAHHVWKKMEKNIVDDITCIVFSIPVH